MESIFVIAVWVLVIGVIVGALAWFGPRPSQWRSHDPALSESEPEGTHDETAD